MTNFIKVPSQESGFPLRQILLYKSKCCMEILQVKSVVKIKEVKTFLRKRSYPEDKRALVQRVRRPRWK